MYGDWSTVKMYRRLTGWSKVCAPFELLSQPPSHGFVIFCLEMRYSFNISTPECPSSVYQMYNKFVIGFAIDKIAYQNLHIIPNHHHRRLKAESWCEFWNILECSKKINLCDITRRQLHNITSFQRNDPLWTQQTKAFLYKYPINT